MQQLGYQDQLAIGIVGLPFRGKTLLSRKIIRYMQWFGFKCKVFNVGNYRRQSHGFQKTREDSVISQAAKSALTDMVQFLNNGGTLAIFDSLNLQKNKRMSIYAELKEMNPNIHFFWIECIGDDEDIMKEIFEQQYNNPDYLKMNQEEKKTDIADIIKHHSQNYQHLSLEEKVPFLKIYNAGKHYEVHGIKGFLPTKVLSYVMNIHIFRKPVYLVRHGQSLYNIDERLGGDPDLSDKGYKFASHLEEFFKKELGDEPAKRGIRIYTSTLRRAIQTASHIKLDIPVISVKNLDEINAGICDGITYKEMEQQYPDEAVERKKDKLTYRYPRGESYLDLISRLESVIYEIERSYQPVIIVAHQAILRCLYAYFNYRDIKEIPFLHIPQHVVMKLVPEAYVCKETRFIFDLDSGDVKEQIVQTGEVQLVDTITEL